MIQIKALNDNEIIDNIVSLVNNYLPRAQVILFGSRAKGTNKNNSDFDIAIKSKSLNIKQLTAIRDSVLKLDTLKNIEIINYYDLDDNFKNVVDTQGRILNA